jgi:hypothetical protein
MEKTNYLIIAVVGVIVVALILLLIRKNKQDRKRLNPGAPDTVEETIADQQRESDSM